MPSDVTSHRVKEVSLVAQELYPVPRCLYPAGQSHYRPETRNQVPAQHDVYGCCTLSLFYSIPKPTHQLTTTRTCITPSLGSFSYSYYISIPISLSFIIYVVCSVTVVRFIDAGRYGQLLHHCVGLMLPAVQQVVNSGW